MFEPRATLKFRALSRMQRERDDASAHGKRGNAMRAFVSEQCSLNRSHGLSVILPRTLELR
jgi:hypothetical protein